MAETKKVQKLDIHSLENGIDHWELLDLIGEGTYGEVYKGQSKEDDKKLAAIKVIDYVVSKSEEIQAELTVFRKHSKHHNIVDFYGAYMFENSKEFKIQLWMAMEVRWI